MQEPGNQDTITQGVTRSSRRWDLLCLLSVLGLLQSIVWNTWGPLAATTNLLYEWSPATIALLASHGPTMYLVCVVPVAVLVRKSLRVALLLTSGCIVLGTFLRASFLPSPGQDPSIFLAMCHICAALNGVSTTVLGSGTLVLSFLWFSQEELGTALTISQVFFSLGPGLPFLMATQMVEPLDQIQNSTSFDLDLSPQQRQDLTNDLQWYLYSQAIPAAILFILTLVYFPSGESRVSRQGIRDKAGQVIGQISVLATNSKAWILSISSALPQGIARSYLCVIVFGLLPVCDGSGVCLSQHWSNTLAILASVTSILAGMPAVRLTSALPLRHLILTLCLLHFASLLAFTFLSLVVSGALPSASLTSLQISILFLLTTGYSLVISSVPLSHKVAMDTLSPQVHPSIIGCWLNLWTNVCSLIFLAFLSIPSFYSMLSHIALPISSGLGLILLAPMLSFSS